MVGQSRWVRSHIECPEGKDEHDLLIALRDEGGKRVLRAISCDNRYLEDFTGRDYEWSCWEEISEE